MLGMYEWDKINEYIYDIKYIEIDFRYDSIDFVVMVNILH